MTIADHNDISNKEDWRSFLLGYYQKDRPDDKTKREPLFRLYLRDDNLTDEQKKFIEEVKRLDEGQGVWMQFELIHL